MINAGREPQYGHNYFYLTLSVTFFVYFPCYSCYRFTLLPAIPDKATTPVWEYHSDLAPVWLLSRDLRQCFLHECCPCSADYYVSPVCYAASEAHLLRLRCLKRGKLIRKGCTCIAIYKAELFIYSCYRSTFHDYSGKDITHRTGSHHCQTYRP